MSCVSGLNVKSAHDDARVACKPMAALRDATAMLPADVALALMHGDEAPVVAYLDSGGIIDARVDAPDTRHGSG